MYIIGLNGPPRCGKDSIGAALSKLINQGGYAERHALSSPMRRSVFSMMGLPYADDTYESLKDTVLPALGTTIRQAMIDLSEDHVKPKYGTDFWSQSLLRAADIVNFPANGVLIVTDIGFQPECDVFDKAVGADRHVTVQISREGFNWGNDSRLYCHGENWIQVDNVSIESTAGEILQHLRDSRGWLI